LADLYWGIILAVCSRDLPKVSVVVPNYNHARFLPKRIDSILRQTFQDFELILLDDCSTDESQAILSQHASDPRVRLVFNQVNSGSPFKQWNKGVRLAQGKYVWITESDDYADPRLLERLVPVLNADPAVAFAYCRSWRVTEDDRRDGFGDSYLVDLGLERWSADYLADGYEECRNYFVHRNIVGNASAVLFRKELFERIGGADEGLRMCGDWKVWASMALLGQVAYISEPLSFFRAHSDSIWGKGRKRGLAAEETLRVVRWMAGQVTPSDFASGIMFDTLARDLWIPAVISRQVPLHQKWMILWDAMAIDRRAKRRLAGALAVGLRLKFLSAVRRLGHGVRALAA
jgi:glycosyltransferase involved in cell wall biosynthesis